MESVQHISPPRHQAAGTFQNNAKNHTCWVLVTISLYMMSMLELVVLSSTLTITSACWIVNPKGKEQSFIWSQSLITEIITKQTLHHECTIVLEYKNIRTTLFQELGHCVCIKEKLSVARFCKVWVSQVKLHHFNRGAQLCKEHVLRLNMSVTFQKQIWRKQSLKCILLICFHSSSYLWLALINLRSLWR